MSIRKAGKSPAETRLVHTLVAETFHGPRPAGLEVRHLNGQSLDNRAENLQWASHSVNVRDRRKHGTDHNANKTQCPLGHAYDEANTYRCKRGLRNCRTCNRLRARERYVAPHTTNAA